MRQLIHANLVQVEFQNNRKAQAGDYTDKRDPANQKALARAATVGIENNSRTNLEPTKISVRLRSRHQQCEGGPARS